MRPVVLVALGCAVALAAGCGSGSTSFSENDLPGLVLTSAEAPPGTVYAAAQSGAGALEKEQDGAETVRQLRQFGFQADYASMFFGKTGFGESIAVLFHDEQGASDALAFMKRLFGQEIPGTKQAPAGGLGDEAWAFAGVFFPDSPPGTFYGWRRGNVLLLLNIAPSTPGSVRPVVDDLDGRAD